MPGATATKKPATKRTAAPKDSAPAGGPDAEGDAGGDVDVAPAKPSAKAPKVGDIVQYSSFDHYAGAGGEDVTVPALVVAVDDELGATIIPLGGPHPTVPFDALSAG